MRRRGKVPVAVALAQLVLSVVAVGHLVVVVLTLGEQDELRQDLAAVHPGADPAQLASTATVTALAVHVPLLVLTAVLAATLRTGHPWVLRPATVSQLFAVACSRLSTPPLHLLAPVVPAAVVAAVAVIALLWLPVRSRAFFAAHPRSRSSRRAETSLASSA